MTRKRSNNVFNIPDTGLMNQNKIKSGDNFFPSMSPSESLKSISLTGSGNPFNRNEDSFVSEQKRALKQTGIDSTLAVPSREALGNKKKSKNVFDLSL